MKKTKIFIILLAFAVLIISLGVLLFGGTNEQAEAPQPTVTEVDSSQPTSEVVASQESFSKFYAALQAAALLSSLDSGDITLFAPNNRAFDGLPSGGNFDETLNESIVNYHIVKAKLAADNLSDTQKVPTLAGADLVVAKNDDGTFITDAKGNKAKILTTDISTSNGVIHEIDAVLLPQ